MLNQERANEIAAANEKVVAKQFKKLGYEVERLDGKSSKSPRPDFLISNSGGCRQILCEVKTILSAGYLPDRHANISTQDENFKGRFTNEIDLRKIHECLEDAARKRTALVADDSSCAELPLLVAFFFDPYADFLDFFPRQMDKDISGILTIETDVARTKAFAKLPLEEMRRRLETDSMDDLPRTSKGFVVVRNKAAQRRVPKDFELRCVTEGYDES